MQEHFSFLFNFYKEIQQAYYNAVASQEKYRSSIDARESVKLLDYYSGKELEL